MLKRKKCKHHGGNSAKSERLKPILQVLSDAAWHTTTELSKKNHSVALHSDISDLRKNGFTIHCEYSGLSRTGRKIYKYMWDPCL